MKRSKLSRGTHILVSTEGGTNQHMERKQVIQEHSHPGEYRGNDKSAHGKEVSYSVALTSWRTQRKGQIRTWKGSKLLRSTHFLESAEG